MHVAPEVIVNKIISPDLDVKGLLGDAIQKYELRHYAVDTEPSRPFGDHGQSHFLVNNAGTCILEMEGRTTSGYVGKVIPPAHLKTVIVNALADQHYTGENNGKDSLPMLVQLVNHFTENGWDIYTLEYDKQATGAAIQVAFRRGRYQWSLRANPVYSDPVGELGFTDYGGVVFQVPGNDTFDINKPYRATFYIEINNKCSKLFQVKQGFQPRNVQAGVPAQAVLDLAKHSLDIVALTALEHAVNGLLANLVGGVVTGLKTRYNEDYSKLRFSIDHQCGFLDFDL